MKTAAIIAEYNPFHTGHEYHINKIRDEFGKDTRIIAIMSGNYTQRGDVAVMDKFARAKSAVLCGVNLVLELPFPFSSSSAELFAKSGVKIADSIGVVDYLSFGSESGDVSLLSTVSENMTKAIYKSSLLEAQKSEKNKDVGYPRLCEMVYNRLFGSEKKIEFTPNNILAIEYIKALLELKSNVKPHTVKRAGASFDAAEITEDVHQSAGAIRTRIFDDFESALKYIPDNTKSILVDEYEKGHLPCDIERISSAIICNLRLTPTPMCSDLQDLGGGLYNRLRSASFEASTINKLTELTDTKKYTTARIKRAIWNSFFGVTSSFVKALPCYTQVLGMDEIGKTILKEMKKVSDFPVVTKPSAFSFLDKTAIEQKLLCDAADSVFQLTKPDSPSGNLALKTTPFIVK